MEHSSCPMSHDAMKWGKPKTKKLSESKCKGRKIIDIGMENEEQKKK
jgi:hypothetical protein